jgi:AraC-like DNA-binding protein
MKSPCGDCLYGRNSSINVYDRLPSSVSTLVSYDTDTIRALGSYGIKATIKKSGFEKGLIESEAFIGEMFHVSKVRTCGLDTWQSCQPETDISISINISGSYGGKINSRFYNVRRGKLSFVSLPGEVQNSRIASDETCGWMISLSHKKFLSEVTKLTQEEMEPSRFLEALEGSEGFLEGAAEHLLWLQRSSPQSWSQMSIDSTTTAVTSFVAARIAEMYGARDSQVTSRSLASYVDSAVSFMESLYMRPLSLGDLCEACHVSSRTLQVAFRQLRGETPMQALRGIRLEVMRGLLLQGEDVSVASVKVGLSPTGRTAALYFAVYGEKPSQTALKTIL